MICRSFGSVLLVLGQRRFGRCFVAHWGLGNSNKIHQITLSSDSIRSHNHGQLILQYKMNNSFDFDYQMRRLSIRCCSSIPLPPTSLSSSLMSFSSVKSQQFEHDCSRFAATTPLSSSNCLSTSHIANKWRIGNQGWGSGGLLRSRCVNNLLPLGDSLSSASDDRVILLRRIPSYEARPNADWGYFVDTPSR